MMSCQKLPQSPSTSKVQNLLKSTSNTDVSEKKKKNMWYMGSLVHLRDLCTYVTHNMRKFFLGSGGMDDSFPMKINLNYAASE